MRSSQFKVICDWERILIGGVFVTFDDNFNEQIFKLLLVANFTFFRVH